MNSRPLLKQSLQLFLALTLSLGLIVPTSLAASAYQTTGLMFYFDFSNLGATTNGSSLTDLSGNSRNGTVRGTGITSDTANKAIKFPGGTNGSNYVELTGAFADFGNGISIEFEAEFGALRSPWERIFDFGSTFIGNNTDNQFWVGQLNNTNELAIETWIDGVNQGRCHTVVTNGALGAAGSRTFAKWLITVGDEGGTTKCRIYKDGSELPTRVQAGGGNELGSVVATGGSAYPLPKNIARSSNFLGRSNWPDADFEGSIRYLRMYNTALTPTQVQENAVTSYAVTYDEHGGSAVADGTFTQGGTLTYPTNPTRAGYTFQGWFAADTGGSPRTASAVAADNASVTLHAQWSPNSYNVVYDENGGSDVADGSYTFGSNLTYPATPTKTGHTFLGWFDATSGGSALLASAVDDRTTDSTLHAQWSANTYNVTFDEHGGSSVADGSYRFGNAFTYPANPTLSGYNFSGWFDTASGGSPLLAATISARTAHSALHAQWDANTYTVTYDEHGGSTVADGSYVFGNTLVFPTAPTRDGYRFDGWFTSSSGGSAQSASAVSAGTTNAVLHAQWTALPVQTITWSPSNSSVLTSQSPVTPSSLATTSGDGAISYSVASAGATGCSVNSTTGVVTFSGVGICTVRATASSTANYVGSYRDVDYNVTSSTPALSLNLGMTSGATVANSVVDYGASGLQANSAWSLILRSTPQTIASGTYNNSVLSGSAQIPSGLPAGWHSITLTGIGANGSTLSHAVWFEVSSSGTLLQTSGSDPAPVDSTVVADSGATALSLTGANSGSTLMLSALVVLLGASLVATRRLLKK